MISWGYQKHPKDCSTDKRKLYVEYTRKWRVTANVKKSAVVVLFVVVVVVVFVVVVVCNEDKVNTVNVKWKWGEDDYRS